MVKLSGYGGTTQHWDHALESLTLMAAIDEADRAATSHLAAVPHNTPTMADNRALSLLI